MRCWHKVECVCYNWSHKVHYCQTSPLQSTHEMCFFFSLWTIRIFWPSVIFSPFYIPDPDLSPVDLFFLSVLEPEFIKWAINLCCRKLPPPCDSDLLILYDLKKNIILANSKASDCLFQERVSLWVANSPVRRAWVMSERINSLQSLPDRGFHRSSGWLLTTLHRFARLFCSDSSQSSIGRVTMVGFMNHGSLETIFELRWTSVTFNFCRFVRICGKVERAQSCSLCNYIEQSLSS